MQIAIELHGESVPSPDSHSEVHLAWMTLVLCTSLDDLKFAWLSLLCVAGTIISHPTKIGGLVVHISTYGAITWRAQAMKVGGIKVFRMLIGNVLRQWEFVSLTDLEGWRAGEIQALTPRDVAALGSEAKRRGLCGVHMRLSGPAIPLARFSARGGFAALTVPFLAKLVTIANVPYHGAKTKTEPALTTLLVKHYLP